MVRGSGSSRRQAGRESGPLCRVNGRWTVRCGLGGGWSDRRGSMARMSWPPRGGRPYDPPMQSSRRVPPRPTRPARRSTGTAPRGDARRRRVSPSRSSPSQTPFVARARAGRRGRVAPRRSPCSSGPWRSRPRGSLLVVGRPAGWPSPLTGCDRARRPSPLAARPRRPAGRRHRRRRRPEPRRTARSRARHRSVRGRGPPRAGAAHGDPPGRVRRGKRGRATGWMPDRAPARPGGARRRSRPSLARPRPTSTSSSASTRRSSSPTAPVTRSPACAVITARPAPGLDRVAAPPAEPDRASPARPGRGRPDGRAPRTHGAVGRGARTRTWNQRDISPPL